MEYYLTSHPQFGDEVIVYEAQEALDLLGPEMVAALRAGDTVFRSGTLWVDMKTAALARIDNTLEG